MSGVALHVLGRGQHGRLAPLVQGRPAGEVERQAQAEADAGLDLPHALEHLFGREQVDAAEFVIFAPVAPRRAWWALLPPLRHGRLLLLAAAIGDRLSRIVCTDRLV